MDRSGKKPLFYRCESDRLLFGSELKALLQLPGAPRRIEVYDNSHIQGTNAVGAMIVAGPDGFVKNQYRKFNIKTADLVPGDDYAMMREVLTRRFKRLVLDEAEAPNAATEEVPAGDHYGSRIEPPQPPLSG